MCGAAGAPTGTPVARGQSGERLDQLRRLDHLEVGIDQTDDLGQRHERVGADFQQAGVLVDRREHAKPRPHARGDALERIAKQDTRPVRPRGRRQLLGQKARDVALRRFAGHEPRSARTPHLQAIHAERPPVAPVDVPGDQIPATSPADDAVRLDDAPALDVGPIAVAEAQLLVLPARGGDRRQERSVDRGYAGGAGYRDDVQSLHPVAQARREDLLDLGHGPQRGFCDPADDPTRRGAQADRDGDGFVIVQQQRWQCGAGTKAVATGALRRVHRIPQVAQPLHVATDRPRADLETRRELGAGPYAPRLEEREEAEEARRRIGHSCDCARCLGPIVT
jgi:hypothetical protein